MADVKLACDVRDCENTGTHLSDHARIYHNSRGDGDALCDKHFEEMRGNGIHHDCARIVDNDILEAMDRLYSSSAAGGLSYLEEHVVWMVRSKDTPYTTASDREIAIWALEEYFGFDLEYLTKAVKHVIADEEEQQDRLYQQSLEQQARDALAIEDRAMAEVE